MAKDGGVFSLMNTSLEPLILLPLGIVATTAA